MNQLAYMKKMRNAARLARWKDHPFVLGASNDQERLARATALDFEQERLQERAADIAAEALESARRGFFGNVVHYGIIFILGVVPDAVDDFKDWTLELFKRRKN